MNKKEIFVLLTNQEGSSKYKTYFQKYGIELDDWYYTTLDDITIRMVDEVNVDPDSIPPYKDEKGEEHKVIKGKSLFDVDRKVCEQNIKVMFNMLMITEIEAVWKEYGVDASSKSGATKKLNPKKSEIVANALKSHLEIIYNEMEDGIENVKLVKAGQFAENKKDTEDTSIKSEPQQTPDSEVKDITETTETGAVSSV